MENILIMPWRFKACDISLPKPKPCLQLQHMKPRTPSASIPSPHLQPLTPLMYPIAASQDPHLVTTINCDVLLLAQHQYPYSTLTSPWGSVVGVELHQGRCLHEAPSLSIIDVQRPDPDAGFGAPERIPTHVCVWRRGDFLTWRH